MASGCIWRRSAPARQRSTLWISCRPGFFLTERVLSRLFRRLFLERLLAAPYANRLKFFGEHADLADAQAFSTYLAPLRRAEWVVYACALREARQPTILRA